ncbi:cation diffusion facilitator family transporter [Utexia brackfieldae]|uniref:cation diffusion facilitator family transporter n=1 Tax=Utexia brackfieldae TaxID=3074108 RepID=UPI00370D9189
MNYDKLVRRATHFAVISASILLFTKMIVWWLTGSISLLASLLDSGVDILASVINLFLVRYALQPADRNHTFGHGKAESLSALAQSGFVMSFAIILAFNSVKSLFNPKAINFPLLGILISVISLIFTVGLVVYQHHVVKKTGSQAIKADMLHYQSDVMLNIAVLLSLLISWLGFIYADGIFALVISLYILGSAIHIGINAIQSLLDRALPDEEIRQILQIACEFPQVKGVHDIRTRQSGKTKFIQIHLELADDMPLIQAHSIADKVEKALQQVFVDADIIIHQDPVSVVEHEIMEKNEIETPQFNRDEIKIE